ncbi:hypothetical protein [Dactylosporangium sp. CA-139066]|uniref:hypothetical protein n=1 Tax=Dactylosporangium sp. CA-139066 TaxID=3239930 RepID=UPI003D919EC3
MKRFMDRLAQVAITASSPDGGIKAEVRADDYFQIWFAAGAYERYNAHGLSQQLARLATLLWTKYRREYLYTLEEHLGGLHDHGFERQEERIYWERLEELVARGASDRGEVRVQSRALVSWEFDVDIDALRTFSEAQFVAALRAAVSALLSDYRARLTLLTDEVLGLGLPGWFRADALRDAQNA